MKKNLYLKELESEAIFILREVVAEFKKPVMLYSVGKDSSVMLHLARKAFFPSKIPFHYFMWIQDINLEKCMNSEIRLLKKLE